MIEETIGYSGVRCVLTSNYRQQMQVKGAKGNRVRIILLKEASPHAGLYDHHRTRPSLAAPFEQPMAKPKVNRSSIAYLSSILQDEHTQQERKTLPPPQTPVKRHYLQQGVDNEQATIEKLDHFRRSGKKSNRYLSSLLETTEERESTAVHAKTEGIEKLLRRRKILPIDKITQRRKNITFSLKNKRELNQDFHQFVQQRTVTAAREQTQVLTEDRETIAFPLKPDLQKRVSSLRGEKERRKSRGVMHHLQLMEPNLPLPPNFVKKNTSIDSREPGYAVAFKRLSSDIPELNSFEWSRLDQNPYKLAKQPQQA